MFVKTGNGRFACSRRSPNRRRPSRSRPQNNSRHSLLSRLTDPSAKTAEIRGFCTYVDKDGDQLFEQCDWMPASPNNCNITGGTGKFEGLQAALVVTIDPLKSNFDGISQVIGHK